MRALASTYGILHHLTHLLSTAPDQSVLLILNPFATSFLPLSGALSAVYASSADCLRLKLPHVA
jgi:hypothetical protein